MNKLKKLAKRLVVEGVVVVVAVAVAFGLMSFSKGLLTASVDKKTQADGALSQDNTQLAAMKNQLDKSGEAEKRYVDIQLSRTSDDFSSNTEALADWMRSAKARYRFANNFKLSLPPETTTDKTELSGLDYDVKVRNGISLDLGAISDLHVFSFIDDMRAGSPGMIRITGVEIEREGDLDMQALAQLTGGVELTLVNARILFNWIGINEKTKEEDKSATPGAPGAVPPVPGMP